MNTKNNRRAQETRQRIQAALLELLEEQELDQITVSQLCQRAEVNRSTFYAHYDDVLSLMEETEKKIGETLVIALGETQRGKSGQDNGNGRLIDQVMSMEYLVAIMENIQAHQNFYRAFLHTSYGTRHIDWGFGQLMDLIIWPMMKQLGISDVEAGYYFAYVQAGLIEIIRRWVGGGCAELPEEMAKIVHNLTQHPEFSW